jgi:hypothetical protein
MEHLELVNDMYTRVNKNFNKDLNENENENSIQYTTKKNKNSGLDFLLYDEMDEDYIKTKKIDKIKSKLKKNVKKEKNIYFLYISLFISFYILNSYYIINLFNSYKLSYNFSLIIRGIIFLGIYYYINENS